MLGFANTGKKHFHHPDVGVAIKPQAFSHGDDYIIPPPPPLGKIIFYVFASFFVFTSANVILFITWVDAADIYSSLAL